MEVVDQRGDEVGSLEEAVRAQVEWATEVLAVEARVVVAWVWGALEAVEMEASGEVAMAAIEVAADQEADASEKETMADAAVVLKVE